MRIRSFLMEPDESCESMLIELEGETVKRLDSSNDSNKTAVVVTAAARTRLGGDSANEITATSAAQAWLVTRRRRQQDKLVVRWRQHRDNSKCGRNGGGANLAWRQRQDGYTAAKTATRWQ